MAMEICEFAYRQSTDLYCFISQHNHTKKPWRAYLEDVTGVKGHLNGAFEREGTCGLGATPQAAIEDLCRNLSHKYVELPVRKMNNWMEKREVFVPELFFKPLPTDDVPV